MAFAGIVSVAFPVVSVPPVAATIAFVILSLEICTPWVFTDLLSPHPVKRATLASKNKFNKYFILTP